MEGLIDHLMTCSRLNQAKMQSLKVHSHYSAQYLMLLHNSFGQVVHIRVLNACEVMK